jgi:Spy/CpxP family protein refolding chaperone
MKATTKFGLGVTLVAVLGLAALPYVPSGSVRLAAQKKGGGGGGSSLGGAKGRLDAMEAAFTLTKDQKNHIKVLMDEAAKTALPIREAMTKTHADVALAIQAGKAQPEIDAAAKAYAEQATAMMAIEMKAMAAIMKELTEQQRANNPAISQTFFALRSAFLTKNWNDIPDGKNY